MTLAITSAQAPPAFPAGSPVDFAFTASGGTPPYTWSMDQTNLANTGLVFNAVNPDPNTPNEASLTGTPVLDGNFQCPVMVTDSTMATATQNKFNVTVVTTDPRLNGQNFATVTLNKLMAPFQIVSSYFTHTGQVSGKFTMATVGQITTAGTLATKGAGKVTAGAAVVTTSGGTAMWSFTSVDANNNLIGLKLLSGNKTDTVSPGAAIAFNEIVTYKASGLPPGVKISNNSDTVSASLTGTPSATQAAVTPGPLTPPEVLALGQFYPAYVVSLTATGSCGGLGTAPFYLYVVPNDSLHCLDPSDPAGVSILGIDTSANAPMDGQPGAGLPLYLSAYAAANHTNGQYGISGGAITGPLVQVPAGAVWDGGGTMTNSPFNSGGVSNIPSLSYSGPVYISPNGIQTSDRPDGSNCNVVIRNAGIYSPYTDNTGLAGQEYNGSAVTQDEGTDNIWYGIFAVGANQGQATYHSQLVYQEAFFPRSATNPRYINIKARCSYGDGMNILAQTQQGPVTNLFVENFDLDYCGRESITVGTVTGATIGTAAGGINIGPNSQYGQDYDFESDLGGFVEGHGSDIGSTDVIITNSYGVKDIRFIESLQAPVNNPCAVQFVTSNHRAIRISGEAAGGNYRANTIKFTNGGLVLQRNPTVPGISINGWTSNGGAIFEVNGGVTAVPAGSVTSITLPFTPAVADDLLVGGPNNNQVTVTLSATTTAVYTWAGTVSGNEITGLTHISGNGNVAPGQDCIIPQPAVNPCTLLVEDNNLTHQTTGGNNVIPPGWQVLGGGVLELVGNTWDVNDNGQIEGTGPDMITVGGTTYDVFTAPANYGPNANGSQVSENAGTGIPPTLPGPYTATFTQGTNSNFPVTNTGNPLPTLSVISGTLPPGLSLTFTAFGWLIEGTPTGSTGSTSVTIQATSSAGTVSHSYTITVNASTSAPSITSASSTSGTLGSPLSFQAAATGSPTPTWSKTGSLPGGVTLSPNGLLSGTPTAFGVFPFVLEASNGINPPATQNFTLTINAVPFFVSADATTFTEGATNGFPVVASGYPAPSVALTSGTLPTGVSFSGGSLSGVPTQTGTFDLVFTATNSQGSTPQSFTLTVNAADDSPSITSKNSLIVFVGQPISFQVTAVGTPAPTITEQGALPANVTWNAKTARLGGTAAAIGTTIVTFIASNGVGNPATQRFTISVISVPTPVGPWWGQF